MIDTLSLGTTDFTLSKKHKLTYRIDAIDTGLIHKKLYYNTNNFYLTLDGKGLRLHFSAPKLFGYSHNFFSLSQKDFLFLLQKVQNMLFELGIESNLMQFKILRLDLFRNVQTKYNFSIYTDILRTLNLRRTYKREYQEGFLSANSLREICFYNKVKELKKNIGPFVLQEIGINTENIIRGEVRLLKHREVKKNNITFVEEIPDAWNLFKNIYKSYMENIFSLELKKKTEIKVCNKEIINIAKKLLIEKDKAFDIFGFYPFFYLNREELKNILLMKYKKDKTYRLLRKIEKEKREYFEFCKSMDFQKLYTELKRGFLEF